MASVNDRWAFAGKALNSDLLRVMKIDGWEGLPALRGSDHVVPGRTGRTWAQKVRDSRRIALGLLATDSDGDPLLIGQAIEQLSSVFAVPGQQSLQHFRFDGTLLTAQAEVATWSPADTSKVGRIFEGVAEFELAYPWFDGASIISPQAQFHASPLPHTLIGDWGAGVTSAGPWTIHNPGDVRTRKIVVTIYGAAGNAGQPFVTFTNETNGQVLTYNGYVGDTSWYTGTEQLIIDCDNATCTVIDGSGGQSNGLTLISRSGGADWMNLEPGDNVVSLSFGLTPSSTGGALSVQFTPAYL